MIRGRLIRLSEVLAHPNHSLAAEDYIGGAAVDQPTIDVISTSNNTGTEQVHVDAGSVRIILGYIRFEHRPELTGRAIGRNADRYVAYDHDVKEISTHYKRNAAVDAVIKNCKTAATRAAV